MITGRLAQIHFSTIRRCVWGITSAGSFHAQVPRATMMPYEASMISSIFPIPPLVLDFKGLRLWLREGENILHGPDVRAPSARTNAR